MAKIAVRKRGDTFHLVKRVPVRYQTVEPRSEIWISLKTDSETAAHRSGLAEAMRQRPLPRR